MYVTYKLNLPNRSCLGKNKALQDFNKLVFFIWIHEINKIWPTAHFMWLRGVFVSAHWKTRQPSNYYLCQTILRLPTFHLLLFYYLSSSIFHQLLFINYLYWHISIDYFHSLLFIDFFLLAYMHRLLWYQTGLDIKPGWISYQVGYHSRLNIKPLVGGRFHNSTTPSSCQN